MNNSPKSLLFLDGCFIWSPAREEMLLCHSCTGLFLLYHKLIIFVGNVFI